MTKTWIERIDEAESRGWFTEEDFTAVDSWVICACGEQDGGIPRGKVGEPKDDCLFHLGDKFCSLVYKDEYKEARQTLARIQQRAIEVLAEEKK